MGDKPGTSKDVPEKPKGKRLDLSVPQVAGSAVAAVVAAKLASGLGVYGTIVGAGVVSALATCGGTLFQHFFRRTGEQIRDVAGQAIPKNRQVPVTREGRPVPETFRSDAVPSATATVARRTSALPRTTTWGMAAPAQDAEATTVLPAPGADATTVLPVEGGDATTVLAVRGGDATTVLPDLGGERTQLLKSDDHTRLLTARAADPEKTRLLRAVVQDDATRVLRATTVPEGGDDGSTHGLHQDFPHDVPDEFTEGTTHRARVRSWKRPLMAAALVFGVTMGGITTYELASGQSFSGDDEHTTVREAFTGGGSSPRNDHTPAPGTSQQQQPSDGGSAGTHSGAPQDGGGSRQGGTTEPTPTPTASADSHTGPDSGTGTGAGGGSGTGADKSTPTPTPTPTPSASQSSPGADASQQAQTPAG
ncbi:hypothetical protein ACFVTY_21105 [Streptomyces sp. NPDC058067]|uniref:hypothetical protein n=1 Tax=Streptomyces sp. NPDC058067 TaxID=3346324 RepID=UPI0036EE85C6